MRDLDRPKFPKSFRTVDSQFVRLGEDRKRKRFNLAVKLLENGLLSSVDDFKGMKEVYSPHMDDFTEIEILHEAHLILLRQYNVFNLSSSFVHLNLTGEERLLLKALLNAKGPMHANAITTKYKQEFNEAKFLHKLPLE
jgi:hypothetical protein